MTSFYLWEKSIANRSNKFSEKGLRKSKSNFQLNELIFNEKETKCKYISASPQVSTDLFTFMKENLCYVDHVDRVNTANMRVTFGQRYHCSHLKSGFSNVNLEKMLHVVYVSLITWLGKSWKVWTQKILTGKPGINLETAIDKSSFSQMFFKKDVLKNVTVFTGNTCAGVS